MKRVGMTDDTAEDFKAGKLSAKGKKRKAAKKHDAELEGQASAHLATHKRPKTDSTIRTEITGGQLRGVVGETFARVYEELWPGMEVHGYDGSVDIEIAEEAYILSLTMIGGNMQDSPRQGLKINEADISDTAEWCNEHAA
jgi:hypothetical protein